MKHDILESMISISLRAGSLVQHYYQSREFGVSIKKDKHDLVTDIDRESQRIIKEELQKRFPNIPIIGEEDNQIIKNEHAFIIDPIDGTLNFVKQIPFFTISIGYWKKNHPVCGVVYDPLRNDLFYARKDQGAYQNGKEINVLSLENNRPILASDWGHEPKLYQKNINILQKLMKVDRYLFRFLGCASLAICYVGAGILDGYWHYQLSPWDMAAAVLIAQEAGAIVTNIKGEQFDLWGKSILTTSPAIKKDLQKVFASID